MNFDHTLIPLSDQRCWELALQALPYQHTHTHWYNTAMQLASGRDIFLYQCIGPNLKVVCPLQLRRREPSDPTDVCTPYGFSGFISDGEAINFFQEWQNFMATAGYVCAYIACHPNFADTSLFTHVPLQAGLAAYFLDITETPQHLFKQFAHGHQYALKKWQKQKVEIRIDKEEASIAAFLTLYEPFLQRKQATSVYYFGIKALRRILSEEYVFLVTAWSQDVCEAGAIFITANDTVEYFLAASNESGKEHARGIIWSAILHAKQQNLKILQLGCGVSSQDSLSQFKARFGASGRATYYLKQIFNLEHYQVLCKKYQADPLDQQGYFPAYWKT